MTSGSDGDFGWSDLRKRKLTSRLNVEVVLYSQNVVVERGALVGGQVALQEGVLLGGQRVPVGHVARVARAHLQLTVGICINEASVHTHNYITFTTVYHGIGRDYSPLNVIILTHFCFNHSSHIHTFYYFDILLAGVT